MATKRTPLRRAGKARITPAVLELWTRLNEIEAVGFDEEWEPDGRRREYLDAHRDLDRSLGLKPWEGSPLDATTAEPPDWMASNPIRVEGWRKAWDWRCALIEAAREANALTSAADMRPRMQTA